MRIEFENLEASGGRFERLYEPEEIAFPDTELQLLDPVEVRGKVARRNDEAEVRGELHTKVAIPCGRCLKPVELPVDVKFAERFVPAVSWRDEEQHELQQEDLNLSLLVGEGIELDDLVKEEILLAIPGHVLCHEQCKGLCPTCGIDMNVAGCNCETETVDSRWAGLKDLRF
jgi:uncharacterized protein